MGHRVTFFCNANGMGIFEYAAIIKSMRSQGISIECCCFDGRQEVPDTMPHYRYRDLVKQTIDSGAESRHCSVVLGGDGTMLKAMRTVRSAWGGPIFGVNYGTLGFKTPYDSDDFDAAMADVMRFLNEGIAPFQAGGRIILHEPLALAINDQSTDYHGFNDIVIRAGNDAKTCDIEVYIDGTSAYVLRGDGIVVSTAGGSTGYNLSAGGPILDERSKSMILTPICPMSISQRPIVLSSESKVEVQMLKSHGEVMVTVDGVHVTSLREGFDVGITSSRHGCNLVMPENRNQFTAFRKKLGWGRH